MPFSKKIAQILLDTGAVSLSPSYPFKYASGMFGPIYIDCRILNSYPKQREIIIDSLVDYIDKKIKKENIDIIAGVGSSGISFATYISSKLRLPMIYIRESAKGHGRKNQIEGTLNENKKVLLVSDIIGTEDAIPSAINAVNEKNSEILGCFSVFDMGLDASDFLRKVNLESHCLTNFDALLKTALGTKKITPYECDIVEGWRKNPKEWNEKKDIFTEKLFSKNKKDIAEILLNIKAVLLSVKKPFVYTSGIKSPIYCDNRLIMSHPDEWNKIIESFINILIYKIGMQNVDAIAGVDSAGISHASYISQKLHLPMVYVKSKETTHGKYNKIEGKIKKHDKVVVIEDLISTGKSSLEAVDILRGEGAEVVDCLAIFTYDFQINKDCFERKKCNLTCLTDFSTLIDVAKQKQIISPDDIKTVLAWNKNPQEWGTDS